MLKWKFAFPNKENANACVVGRARYYFLFVAVNSNTFLCALTADKDIINKQTRRSPFVANVHENENPDGARVASFIYACRQLSAEFARVKRGRNCCFKAQL